MKDRENIGPGGLGKPGPAVISAAGGVDREAGLMAGGQNVVAVAVSIRETLGTAYNLPHHDS